MEEIKRNLRKQRVGVVTSNKMEKTITISVERRVKHPIYSKTMKSTKSTWLMTKLTLVLSVISCALWKLAL